MRCADAATGDGGSVWQTMPWVWGRDAAATSLATAERARNEGRGNRHGRSLSVKESLQEQTSRTVTSVNSYPDAALSSPAVWRCVRHERFWLPKPTAGEVLSGSEQSPVFDAHLRARAHRRIRKMSAHAGKRPTDWCFGLAPGKHVGPGGEWSSRGQRTVALPCHAPA